MRHNWLAAGSPGRQQVEERQIVSRYRTHTLVERYVGMVDSEDAKGLYAQQ